MELQDLSGIFGLGREDCNGVRGFFSSEHPNWRSSVSANCPILRNSPLPYSCQDGVQVHSGAGTGVTQLRVIRRMSHEHGWAQGSRSMKTLDEAFWKPCSGRSASADQSPCKHTEGLRPEFYASLQWFQPS